MRLLPLLIDVVPQAQKDECQDASGNACELRNPKIIVAPRAILGADFFIQERFDCFHGW